MNSLFRTAQQWTLWLALTFVVAIHASCARLFVQHEANLARTEGATAKDGNF